MDWKQRLEKYLTTFCELTPGIADVIDGAIDDSPYPVQAELDTSCWFIYRNRADVIALCRHIGTNKLYTAALTADGIKIDEALDGKSMIECWDALGPAFPDLFKDEN